MFWAHPDGPGGGWLWRGESALRSGKDAYDAVRATTVIDFPPGAVLVCYTDGLVEHRGEVIDVGIDRLTAVVRPDTAETVCTAIMAITGTEQPTDDIALLAIRRRP